MEYNDKNMEHEEKIVIEQKLRNPVKDEITSILEKNKIKAINSYLNSLTELYFAKACENIAMNMIDFKKWKEYHDMFIQAIQAGVLKDEFIKNFAQTLKSAQVTVFLEYDNDEYVKFIGELEELIKSKEENLKR